MAERQLNWTAEAERWLREIHDYIAKQSPQAARRTIQGIMDKADYLRSHPRMGYRHNPDSDREVRILLYGHYRIAYLIQDESTIDILGVFHAALDIERFLA